MGQEMKGSFVHFEPSTRHKKSRNIITLAAGMTGKFLEIRGYLPPNTTEQFLPTVLEHSNEKSDTDLSLNSFLDLTLSMTFLRNPTDAATTPDDEQVDDAAHYVDNSVVYSAFLKRNIDAGRRNELSNGATIEFRDLNHRTRIAWLRTRTALGLLDRSVASGVEIRRSAGEAEHINRIDQFEKERLKNTIVDRLSGAGAGVLLAAHTYFEDALLSKFSVASSDILKQLPTIGRIPTAAEILALSVTGMLCYGENKVFVKNALRNFDFLNGSQHELKDRPEAPDIYLSMKAMSKIFHKGPEAVRTMIVGAPLGAIYEQLERGGNVEDNLEELAQSHARSFTEIILAINGGLLLAGNAGQAGEMALDVLFNPPTFGAILATLFISRAQSEIFHDWRKEPTLPKKAYDRIVQKYLQQKHMQSSANFDVKNRLEDVQKLHEFPNQRTPRVNPPQPPDEMPKQIDTHGTFTEEI